MSYMSFLDSLLFWSSSNFKLDKRPLTVPAFEVKQTEKTLKSRSK